MDSLKADQINRCISCKNENFLIEPYIESWGHEIFDNLDIKVCQKCGLGSVVNEPQLQEINHYYDEIYRSESCEMYIDFSRLIPTYFDARSFAQLMLAKNYALYDKKVKIVDIGPGPGKSYHAAKQIFPTADIFYVEKASEALAFYKKYFDINILDDLSSVETKFDIMLLSHSLEHFNKDGVSELLKDLYESIDDNGIIVIEVPNNDFRNKIYKDGIERINDTPHLQFFSIESLEYLFKNNGFEILFNNSAGRLISKDTPVDISCLRKTWKESRANSSFYNSSLPYRLKNILKLSLDKLGLLKSITLINTFIFNNGFNDDEFMYGGDRHAIRLVIRKNKNE